MAEDNQALRIRLFNILYRRFNLDELRTLCFLLQVDYDDLAGENKAGKARELIVHLEHRGQLDALIEAGRDLRSDVRWPDLHPPSAAPAERPARVERDKDLAGCVFISYERTDQAYARRLADELRDRGCTPWMDDRIDFGDRWWRTIVRAVRACAAFVVVMTPEAERSDWVEREVLLAQREGKPILPLLLRGREFPLLINVQYVDVTDGKMPPRMFYARLDRTLDRGGAPKAIAPKPSVQEAQSRRRDRAERAPARPKAPAPAQEEKRRPSVLVPGQPFEPEMVLIPASEFLMGSDPAKDKGAYDDEQPQRTLTLPDYTLARAPVTNDQYLAFVQATGQSVPGHWKRGKPPKGKADHPIVYVSWHDACAYCRWLAQATGKPYNLPSEAEWEKGARGIDGQIYPWGNEWDAARCNSAEGGRRGTTPVGAYPNGASPYGLLDMAGNVWEWTRSLYKGYPYDPADGREDLEAGGVRVVRGGSFDLDRDGVRCAFRRWGGPDDSWDHFGFRVVSSISP